MKSPYGILSKDLPFSGKDLNPSQLVIKINIDDYKITIYRGFGVLGFWGFGSFLMVFDG